MARTSRDASAAGAPRSPASLGPDDYVGDPADRTGFGGLEAVDDVTMVCVPDLMAAYQKRACIDLEGVQAVQLAMIAHCELMGDRVAILDPPPGLNAQQIREWRVDKAGYDSKYAALYWPWVKVFDPATGTMTFVPPSGHMAGIWGRNDDTRGVHKAPANEVVRGAISLETDITKSEHDLLNPVGINCIRAFPGRGIRVWGARTLSSDPAWRYVNVRRLFNYLEESILTNTDWVVFEPNDRRPVGQDPPHDRRLPGQGVAQGRPVRQHAGRGVLRQVRRRDQPGRGDRRRARSSARSASRRSSRPSSSSSASPVLRRHQPAGRVIETFEPSPNTTEVAEPWLSRTLMPQPPIRSRWRSTGSPVAPHRGQRTEDRARRDRDEDERSEKGKYIIRKMPGRPKAGEITIKRYFYAHDSFKEWMDKVGLGQVKAARKNGFVNILDTEGNTLKRFQFTNGMAKSLDLGSLQAGSTNPVTETLVIAFEALELVS